MKSENQTIATEVSQRRYLQDWTGTIRSELQDVLQDPLRRFADRVDTFIDRFPEAVGAIAQARITDTVPYSVHDLPPHLYEHSGGTPFVPSTDAELDVFLDSFWSGNLQLHARTMGVHAHATFPEHREHLTLTLRDRREAGNDVIDPEDWAEYQQSYADQLGRGFFNLGHNAAVMNIPRILGLAAARQTPDFASGRQRTYRLASMDSPHSPGLYLRVPSSGYGPAHSDRLLRAGGLLYDLMHRDKRLRDDLWETYRENPGVVEVHTERAVMNRLLYSPAESLIVTSQEGVGSILGSVALAMPEKIPGHDDAAETFAKVIASRIPDKYARLFPLGVAGAASTFGMFFPDALEEGGGQSFAISADTLHSLAEIRARATGIMYERWLDYLAQVAAVEPGEPWPVPPTRTGLSCPAAGAYVRPNRREDGAIFRLSQTLLKAYNAIPYDPSAERLSSPWLPSTLFEAYQ
ncbi:MAG TPA: hypothetical protein VLI54_00765 [Bacillota bacterium]|nr:hypothetical protein [Bacillota bacterium]